MEEFELKVLENVTVAQTIAPEASAELGTSPHAYW